MCEVAADNCPAFVEDLTRKAFGKKPNEIALNVIHPGGARMIEDIGNALELKKTWSAILAKQSMDAVGNVASATVTDMLRMAWDEIAIDDEIVVVGMGPGFVLDGVCLRKGGPSPADVPEENKENLPLAAEFCG